MEHHYNIAICVAEKFGQSCCAIEIEYRNHRQTQTHKLQCGFGSDDMQTAVNKSMLLALTSCKLYDSVIDARINHNLSNENDQLNSVLSRIKKILIHDDHDTQFLEQEALKIVGKESFNTY